MTRSGEVVSVALGMFCLPVDQNGEYTVQVVSARRSNA